jgi:hypothetical protein
VRFSELTVCLQNETDPRRLLGIEKTSFFDDLRWRFSGRYRAQLCTQVEKERSSLREKASELLTSEVASIRRKGSEISVSGALQTEEIECQKTQMITQIKRFNTSLADLQDILAEAQGYQQYFEKILTKHPLFGATAQSRSAELRRAVLDILDTMKGCHSVYLNFSKQLIHLLQNSVLSCLHYMEGVCCYPSVSHEQIREGFPLPLPQIPTSEDLADIRAALGEITEVLDDTLPLAKVAGAGALATHDNLASNALYLTKQTRTLPEDYVTSCHALNLATASHVTRGELARLIIRTGFIASSLHQATHFQQAYCNSPVGEERSLAQVVFSLNGLEPVYGGSMTPTRLKDGRITASLRSESYVSEIDRQTVAFIFPLRELVSGRQFSIMRNSQTRLSPAQSPEVHIFDSKYIPEEHVIGTTIPIEGAKILIPEAQKSEWEHFLLQPLESGGAGKSTEWIDTHVVYYSVAQSASQYFKSKYGGMRDWEWPSGFYQSTGNHILENRDSHFLFRWYTTKETGKTAENAIGNVP